MNWNGLKYYLILIVILLLGLALRVYDLDLDPPLTVGHHSQGLTTDPHHLTSFAANENKFGDPEPFPFPKWRVFRVSLVSAAAALIFKVTSAGRTTANLAGVIPSFLGIMFLVAGLFIRGNFDKYRDIRPALMAAGFLGLNFILITYNRLPFLESGLIFYFGLIFFLFRKYRFQTFNLILISSLVSLSCLTGKIFGISIGLAVLGVIVLSSSEHKSSHIMWYLSGLVISTAILLAILFGDSIPDYLTYLREMIFTAHGSPLGLYSDLKQFVLRPITFGSFTRLYSDSPFLFASFYLAMVIVILYAVNYYRYFRQRMTLQFTILWLFFLALLLIPVSYRPLRYSILLFLPVVILICQAIMLKGENLSSAPRRWQVLGRVVLTLVNWYFLYHLVIDFIVVEDYKAIAPIVIALTFVSGIGITYLMSKLNLADLIFSRMRTVRIVLFVFLALSAVYQGTAYVRWITNGAYSIRDASNDLVEVIGPDAVLTGPYAPTLTIDNNLRHFIYAFGLPYPGYNILEKFPITHLAVDDGSYDVACRDFPETERAVSVTDYHLRNRNVMILRINDQSLNHQAGNYRPTACEKAMEFLLKRDFDSALVYNTAFLEIHPNNRSGMLQRCLILSRMNRKDELIPAARKVSRMFPADSAVQYFCNQRLKEMGIDLKSEGE